MRHRPWPFLALVFFCSAPALGLSPRLVKDINTGIQPANSAPHSFVPMQSLVYFTAEEEETGRELWRTDGTLAGTFRLLDACPGSCDGEAFTAGRDGDRYFFTARDQNGRPVLWVTGGTPISTFRLTGEGVTPGPGSGWRIWIPEQRLLYFAASDGANGVELWRSDGTAAGTFQVADLRPGPAGSFPGELAKAGGRLFFVADDGRGPSLWTSDGTANGTRLVRDPDPRSTTHEAPANLTAAGRTLFFTAPVPKKGRQLWKSDGTAAGTVALTNLRPWAPGDRLFRDLLALGDRLLFVADTPGSRQELWASDGTARGTAALTRFADPAALLPQDYDEFISGTPIGVRLVFEARETGLGSELWVTDGTPKGTRLVRDVCPGPCDGAAGLEYFSDSGRLFFQGNDGTRGAEPWVTDGTAAGTRIVRDLCRGSCGSSPAVFRSRQGSTFFLTRDADFREALWRSDGTPRGTARLAELRHRGTAGLGEIFWGTFAGSRFVFNARDDLGLELWTSDGTATGTGLLLNIAGDAARGSLPRNLLALGSQIVFVADGDEGTGLWRSDGSAGGTAEVRRFTPGPGEPFQRIRDFVEAGGKLFFFADVSNETRPSLWRLDETSREIIRLTPEGLAFPSGTRLWTVGDLAFFTAADLEHGEEVWVSDGTAAGTRMVVDLVPGADDSFPEDLIAFQGKLYFAGSTEQAGGELWSTDGTPEGTVLVKDVVPGPSSSSPRRLMAHGGRLWFFADLVGERATFWSTDGTAAGTRREADLVPRPDFFEPDWSMSGGSRIFLSGGDNEIGRGLWAYDGTGARRISDTLVSTSREATPVVLGDSLYFLGFGNGERGLWKSDGTEGGTVELLDEAGAPLTWAQSFQVFGGRVFFHDLGRLMETDGTTVRKVLNSVASELLTVGGRLFFSHLEPETGSELWVLE